MKCTVMARFLIAFGLFVSIVLVHCNQYDNHTLIRLHPTSPVHLNAVASFQDPSGDISVLKESRGVNDTLDILVPPNKMKFVQNYANDSGLLLEEKQQYYGRSFEDKAERQPRRRVFRSFNIFRFNSFGDIQLYMEETARKYPHLVQLEELGKSYEGRKMKLAKISAQPGAGNPIIFIDAGIHSREWVAPAMATYLFSRLVTDPDNVQIGGVLDGVDWYILPVVNPDGYEYSRSDPSKRLWRKTRSQHSRCFGVDGNRNYGFKWAVSGVSKDPCHPETFAGSKPFSEPETRMVSKVMMDNRQRMKLYVSLHSYGQYLVYPWGYTGDFLPKSWKKLDDMARAVSTSVQKAGGKPFRVMSAGKWYPAAGGSDDFAFGVAGVPYSYTMELTDGYEFTFPERELHNVLPQFYEGFRTFGARIKKEFGKK